MTPHEAKRHWGSRERTLQLTSNLGSRATRALLGVPILLLIVAAIFTDTGRELADVAVWGAIGLVLAIDAALLWRAQGERGIVSLGAAWHVYLTLCAGFIAAMAIGGTWL